MDQISLTAFSIYRIFEQKSSLLC